MGATQELNVRGEVTLNSDARERLKKARDEAREEMRVFTDAARDSAVLTAEDYAVRINA